MRCVCDFNALYFLYSIHCIATCQVKIYPLLYREAHNPPVVTERTDFKFWILGTEFIAHGDSQEHTGQTTGCRHRDADTNTERLRENPQQHSLNPRRGAGA